MIYYQLINNLPIFGGKMIHFRSNVLFNGKKKGEIGWIYLLDEDSSLESKMDVFDG